MASTREVTKKQINVKKLDVTSTSASTTALTPQTYAVRLVSNTPLHYRLFDNGQITSTATSADAFLPSIYPVEIGVTPNQIISAVKSPTAGTITSADGTLWIVELGL